MKPQMANGIANGGLDRARPCQLLAMPFHLDIN